LRSRFRIDPGDSALKSYRVIYISMLTEKMALFRRSAVLTVLAVGLIFVAAGCDLTDEEEDIGLFLGSWVAQNLTVDGISVKAQLDAQYDRLVLTLREGANGGEFFTIIGREEGATENLFVQGTFDRDGKELTLFPNEAPQIEFDRAVTDSTGTRLTLSTEEGASEDLFLELIQLPIQGAVDRLELRLSKGRPSADVSLGNPPDQLTPFCRPPSLAGTVQPTLTLGTRPYRFRYHRRRGFNVHCRPLSTSHIIGDPCVQRGHSRGRGGAPFPRSGAIFRCG
jgi:hypothetical protein